MTGAADYLPPGSRCAACKELFSFLQRTTPGVTVETPLGPVHAARCAPKVAGAAIDLEKQLSEALRGVELPK